MHPAIGEFTVSLHPGEEIVVGRAAAETDIEVSWDRRISRRHARLWAEDGAVWFEDLGSRNGSWQGTEPLVGPNRLRPGSSVVLGETILIIPDVLSELDAKAAESTHDGLPAIDLRSLPSVSTDPLSALEDLLGTMDVGRLEDTDLDRQDLETLVPWPGGRAGELPPEVAELRATRLVPTTAAATPITAPEPVEPPAPPPAILILEPEPARAAPAPEPAPAAPEPARRPRLGPDNTVQISGARPALAALWDEDLSKGGLYAESDRPPQVGSYVEIQVDGPGGPLVLHATVVSAVQPEQAAAYGMRPGVGLQLTDLKGPKRQVLEAYVRGHRRDLSGANTEEVDGPASPEIEAALVRAKKLLTEADRDAYYRGLDLAPECTQQRLRATLDELHATFDTALTAATPPQAARLRAARTVVERLSRILLNPEARLEYDFRAGHVRALERLALAADKAGPDLATLRRVWNRVAPEKVEEAARLTRKAFSARQEHDLEQAVRHGRQALELNPFFEELKKTVDTWEKLRRETSSPDASTRPRPSTTPGKRKKR